MSGPDPRSVVRSIAMYGETISAEELATLADTMSTVVLRIASLEELEGWLRSQRCVESIGTSDYLIKTEPPRKEMLVTFKMDDGSSVTKVVDITLYPDESFGLAGLHDP